MLRRTALYEEHQKAGGKIVPFAGWELPVQYAGVAEEHLACRRSVGIFDVSHMGEIWVEGGSALNFLNFLVTNNVSKLVDGQALYTVMCHDTGGIVDDLIVYRFGEGRFLLVVNASNTTKAFEHMQSVLVLHSGTFSGLSIRNESHRYTQIAVQGRNALPLLTAICSTEIASDIASLKNYHFIEAPLLNLGPTIIARTGYTGEDGFELYVPWESGPALWQALLEKGGPYDCKPCGLAARDTLRAEMRYPLYGHELNDDINPLEAGLGWVVKFDKTDFMGKAALLNIKEGGVTRKCVGFKMLDKRIARQGYPLYDETAQAKIGEVTTGTFSPSLSMPIGVGYVETTHSKVGTRITVEVRGTKVPAEVVPTPFYKRDY